MAHPPGSVAAGADGAVSAGAPFTDIAGVDEMPEGALLACVLPDGAPVCLVNDRGTIGALGNRCTHAEFLMSDGMLHADGTIECIWHGARFDCRTGAVRRHPATDPLPVYPVRVEGGRILVGGAPVAASAGRTAP